MVFTAPCPESTGQYVNNPQVIALVGVGNLGRYICEALLADDRFDVVVLARRVISALVIFKPPGEHYTE